MAPDTCRRPIMTEETTQPPHSIDLEVSGSELDLLKTLLSRIELSSDIRRISIEIESDAPLYKPADDADAESASESAETSASDDGGDDPRETTDAASDDERDASDDERESSHPTDALVAEADDDRYLLVESSLPPIKKGNIPRIREGTNKEVVLRSLRRLRDENKTPATAKQVRNHADTDISSTSTSTSIYSMWQDGMIEKCDSDDPNTQYSYRLTTKGLAALYRLTGELMEAATIKSADVSDAFDGSTVESDVITGP